MKNVTGIQIAQELGIQNETANDYVCKCPLHADNTASFTISKDPDKLLFHCLAGCTNADLWQYFIAQGYIMPKKSESPLIIDCSALQKANDEFFAPYCLEHSDFENYGVTYKQRHYFTGHESSHYETYCYPYVTPDSREITKFRSCLRFEGKRKNMLSRVLDCEKEWKQSNNTKERVALFPACSLRGDSPLYVTGGEEKAILLNKLGFRAVSILTGEVSLSKIKCNWIVNDLGNKNIILIFDCDSAGIKATKTGAALFEQAGAESVLYIPFPGAAEWGNDVNDYCPYEWLRRP